MNKNKVKTILIVLIILILCINVGVYAAYMLSATEVDYTKTDGTTVSVKDALDELYAKESANDMEKAVGDEVTVGGEQFYVLECDKYSRVATLVSKYNLNSDGTAQSSTAGTCAFSSTNYWSSSFTRSPFNLNNISGYQSTDAMGKAKSYGSSKGAVSSRLLSYEEANSLLTKSGSNSKIKSMYANGQSYWLGSATNEMSVWFVKSDGNWDNYYYYANYWAGVRPVITVLKSNVS